MTKRRKRKNKGGTWWKLLVAVAVIGGGVAYYLFGTAMARQQEKGYLYIDADDTIDSVYTKLEPLSTPHALWAFKQLATWKDYANHIRTGRYEIGREGALQTFRHVRNGIQTPVNLTINSVRTVERLAKDVSKRMMFSQQELLSALTDTATCRRFNYTPETIPAMFVPNTYDIYWNASVDKFLERMDQESRKYWNPERTAKAKEAGLTPVEATTLASIVDEETANTGEMPMIAGMYINRLRIGMPLQADPTVKFATRQFEARRIYNSMLRVDSSYNTYRNTGLPPGPIRIPSAAAVEAVLNYAHHDYLYMCAKEDFSGTHNFARTYAEHQQNAARYAKALNERGIK